jgi:hypothetical protein
MINHIPNYPHEIPLNLIKSLALTVNVYQAGYPIYIWPRSGPRKLDPLSTAPWMIPG